jgi:hypothetical protein
VLARACAKTKGSCATKYLEEWLSERRERTIETLASYIEQWIHEQWHLVLEQNLEELVHLYDKAGEAAYGRYAGRLFRPIHGQLTQAGFLSSPSFPGTLSTSREWGPLEERERWMWSVVREAAGIPVGALVVRLVHDHTQFRLPSAPSVLAVKETDTNAIVQAILHVAGQEQRKEEWQRRE